MAGVAVLFIVIWILASRRRGSSISLTPRFWVWAGKYALLVVLPIIFGAAGIVGWALLVPVFILLFAPTFVLELIVVPLGLPRVAYWIARCCVPLGLGKEAGAGGALYGARALARRPSCPQTIGWLEQKAIHARSLRGAGVVAAGLLAALHGDRHRARSLFLVADTLPRTFIPSKARAVARDWLVADAARIGNWREVIRLGRRGKDSLRWSYAVARIAERLAGDPRCCDGRLLWLCSMAAPRRRFTLPLLRRALAVPSTPKQTAAEQSVAGDLPDALADLARLLENRFAHDGRSLARSVSAVDAALDCSATRAGIQQRLLALGAQPDADAVLAGFRTRLAGLLAPLIEEAPNFAGGKDRAPTLDRAIEQVRARLFRDIAAQCKDYDDRRQRESSLDTLAEWRAWAATRESADRLLELAPDSENALFQAMYVPVCNFAVFQHNVFSRTPLAHEIYSWLHRHARSNPSASQHLLKNMRASTA
jgi:hypothetical protein